MSGGKPITLSVSKGSAFSASQPYKLWLISLRLIRGEFSFWSIEFQV